MEYDLAQKESLIEHVENYLGRIQCGWSQTPEGTKLPFQIAKCQGGRIKDLVAYCTIGLSNTALRSRSSGKSIRHELILLAQESFGDRNIPAVLQQLAGNALRHSSAYLQGELIEGRDPIFKRLPFYAFYARPADILPDDFSVYRASDGSDIVLVWMVPVTEKEATFIRANGWTRFEELIGSRSREFTKLDREGFLPVVN